MFDIKGSVFVMEKCVTAIFKGYYTVITEQISQSEENVHIHIMDLNVPQDISTIQIYFSNSCTTRLNQYIIIPAERKTNDDGNSYFDVNIPQQFVDLPFTIRAHIYLTNKDGEKINYRIEVPVMGKTNGCCNPPPPPRPGPMPGYNWDYSIDDIITDKVKESFNQLADKSLVRLDETEKIPKELLPEMETVPYWSNVEDSKS